MQLRSDRWPYALMIRMEVLPNLDIDNACGFKDINRRSHNSQIKCEIVSLILVLEKWQLLFGWSYHMAECPPWLDDYYWVFFSVVLWYGWETFQLWDTVLFVMNW